MTPSKPNISAAGKFFPQGVYVGYYNSEPAPMGLADYGIGPNGPYTRETTQFEGVVSIPSSISASTNDSSNFIDYQLNVVLNYQYNGVTYALWVQNVFEFNYLHNYGTFINNIWNFTSLRANVTGLAGNGQYGLTRHSKTFYYYCANGYPGTDETLSFPVEVYPLVNVTTNVYGQPMVCFWYNGGHGWINYDNVTVENVVNAYNVYFLVDGFSNTGSGNYYDAELVMTGPGGGSCAYIYSGSASLHLYYWNGNNFQGVRNAYNFGSDTAEIVNHVSSTWGYRPLRGYDIAIQQAGNGVLGPLWNTSQIAQLTVYTGLNSGYILVYSQGYPYSPSYAGEYSIPFQGGYVNLSLVSNLYAVLVYDSNHQLVGEASVSALAGEVTATGVTPFSIVPSTSPLRFPAGSSASLTLHVDAYGKVTFNVEAPPGLGYGIQGPTQFQGNGNETITLYSPPSPPPWYLLRGHKRLPLPRFLQDSHGRGHGEQSSCHSNFPV